jgi:hypothetical protein
MRKINYIIAMFCFTLALNSCGVTTPFMVTNNDLGSKVGVSSSICLFSGGSQSTATMTPTTATTVFHGVMLNKNFGIYEAAEKAGISKIGAVDYKVTSYVFFVKKEFIVAGE